MDRTKEHFVERLEKDEYTKEEVAGLLHSEAEFTARSATKNTVSREDYDNLQSELNSTNEKLNPYLEQDFNNKVSGAFTKLNGDSERVNDLVKLSGINRDMDDETINNTVIELKQSGKYDFLFKTEGSGGITHQEPEKPKKEKLSTGNFQTPSGAGRFFDMFKKNKGQ